MSSGHAGYVSSATERYQRAYQQLSELLEDTFPEVERIIKWDMPMWRIPRPEGAPEPEASGTIDPAFIHVGLVERKAGITLHLWYPPEYDLLERNAEALGEVGLKAMKGCVQFNRQEPFPVDALAPLFEHARQRDGF